MTFLLILWIGFIPADFVGPLQYWQPSPAAPRIYYEGPTLLFPQPTYTGPDRIVLDVRYPPAAPATASRRAPAARLGRDNEP